MAIVALQIVLVVLLLFFSAVFSGSETALFSVKTYQVRKLQRHPSRNSIRVVSLLKEPYHLLVAILVGNTLVNVAASSIGTSIVGHFFHQGIVGISVALMSILILIFGEIVPKTYAVNNPVKVSLRYSPVISSAVRAFSPTRGILEGLIRLITRPGSTVVAHGKVPTDAHIAEAIAVGHSEGILDRFEREVLSGLFKIMHLSVQNIMTPRTEVYMLSSGLSVDQAIGTVKSSGYSRIPVFDSQTRDNVVGILYAKDLLHRQYDRGLTLADLARKPFFVPESKPLVDLLREFVSGAAHFATVIDEYGSFTGVVTLDDILGEVMGRGGGKQLDRYEYKKRSRSRWEVSGRMEIEYFNGLIGSTVTDPHAETVAGLILNRIGRIPAIGEELVIGNLRFRILDGDARRLKRIAVEKMKR